MAFDLAQHFGDGERTTFPAALRDDAKGAGVVAAVLHRHEGACVERGHGRGACGHVPCARIELGLVGDQPVDLGHGGELVTLDISGAAGHQQAGFGIGLARLPDRLPRLADRLARHRAAVDDDEIVLARQNGADALALGKIEAAAKGYDLRSVHA